ncbi:MULTISPECIES: hypothetical protein [Bradyrhizobium]|uniref:hypothetical protein n=1 Tax=Bradyrhizobium TaxID=374 RepID=UPI0004B3BB5A|nr:MULTISPECIES: hypothetical protein [unclassified Bradyrhizobium]
MPTINQTVSMLRFFFNSWHRLDLNQPDRPRRSNPDSTCRTALRSLRLGFLHCRLSDAGRRIRGTVPQAADIQRAERDPNLSREIGFR